MIEEIKDVTEEQKNIYIFLEEDDINPLLVGILRLLLL
jgi:hypothetical protein